MPNANPPDGATQPDTDADFRHRPHGHDSGKDAPSVSSPSEGPGVGSAAWGDPGAAPELAGDKPAGGVDADHPHLFHLAEAPANVFDGGGLQGGHEHNWPILKGQQGACYIARLAPGGVREPHWHPYAWEMNFVLQGRVRWTFVGPNSAQDGPFEAGKGDMIFAPQGHFHYFENASDTEDLLVLIVFNAPSMEPDDDIGLVQSFKAMPADVLAAVFGGSIKQFENLPGKLGRVVIASKKGLK